MQYSFIKDISEKLYDQVEGELLFDFPKFSFTLEYFQKELNVTSPLMVSLFF